MGKYCCCCVSEVCSIVGFSSNLLLNASFFLLRLYVVNPAAFKVFIKSKVLPQSEEEIAYSWETKNHGMKVVHFLQRCISRLSEREAFWELTRSVANLHQVLGVTPGFVIDLMGCILEALLHEITCIFNQDLIDSKIQNQLRLITGTIDEKPINTITCLADSWRKFFSIISLSVVQCDMAPLTSINKEDCVRNRTRSELVCRKTSDTK